MTQSRFNLDSPENSPAVNPRVQEALSRKYSDDIIMLLPLRDGSLAVFNAARELCGFIADADQDGYALSPLWESVWHPPTKVEYGKPPVDLSDLELI